MQSKVRITDNSGVRWVKCIKIFRSSKKRGLAPLGICLVSIRKIKVNKYNLIKGKMCKAVLIRSAQKWNRKDGVSLVFKENALILLNDKNLPVASRIIGPIYKEFRSKFYSKVIILSNSII